jgi:hypothetical protein
MSERDPPKPPNLWKSPLRTVSILFALLCFGYLIEAAAADDFASPHASLLIASDELDPPVGFEQPEKDVEDASHPRNAPTAALERVSTVDSNLEVKKLGDEDSTKYKLTADLTIHWIFKSEPFDVDFNGYRARREEQARVKRILEFLVEDIRRTKRERAAAQRRGLSL